MNGEMKLTDTTLPEKVCMQLASELGHHLLPQTSPKIDGAEVAGWLLYSSKLGGDFFDYHDFKGVCCPSSAHMRIVVGDACGHGLCSALLMTTTRAYLRARGMQPGTLSQIVDDVNRLLCMDTESMGHFVTAFFAAVYGSERRIKWVRAGHDPALLYDPEKDMFESLGGRGIALGVDPQAHYTLNTRSGLPRGTIILIATDGLWETKYGKGSSLGKEAVKDLVWRHRHASAALIADAVKRSTIDCYLNSKAEDDITFVVIKLV